jgi:quercetin dioxygenase-like cupin family protein
MDQVAVDEEKFAIDPYQDWIDREGIPVAEDFGVHMHRVETKPWARTDAKGAIVHVKGRGDNVSIFLTDLPPGKGTSPQRHLYEEVVFVLEGHGSTEITAHDGRKHTFEWGPNSLFALPLNVRYRLFNASGRERALLASSNNLALMLNVFHNDDFIFNNPGHFPEREGKESYFSGEGDFIPRKKKRPVWETNFVPDLVGFKMTPWVERGAGGSNIFFMLADGNMHAHMSEMPVGTYKKGHRHGPDFHVCCVTGAGFSLLWYEKDQNFIRVDWDHGVVFSPPDMMFHQHFNTSPTPARYLATALGSQRYPMTRERRMTGSKAAVSVKEGGNQIEYEDQDPRIHQMYLDDMAKHGAQSKMSQFIDESKYAKN